MSGLGWNFGNMSLFPDGQMTIDSKFVGPLINNCKIQLNQMYKVIDREVKNNDR